MDSKHPIQRLNKPLWRRKAMSIPKMMILLLITVPNSIATNAFDFHTEYLSYGTFQDVGLSCNPSYPVQYPKSLSEVQSIVQKALEINSTVKAFGSRHSLTDVMCTDGIPIDMKNIKHIIVNSMHDTVTVGGGTEVLDILNTLNRFNMTLIHVPAFGGITVAGAMGTGAHGSSLRNPTTISDQVVSMVFVDGKGQVRTISDPEDLKAFRVHLGLLGVIYEVTLKTVPQFKLHIVNYPTLDDILFDDNAIVKLAEEHDWFQFWWFPKSSSVVISRGQIVPVSVPGNAKTGLISNLSQMFSFLMKQTLEMAADNKDSRYFQLVETYTRVSLHESVPFKEPVFSEDGITGINPAIGLGYEMISGRCKTCAWNHGQNFSIFVEEFSLAMDINEFSGVVKTLKGLFADVQAYFPMFGLFFRFSPASDAYLAMNHGRRTVHLDWIAPMRKNFLDEPKMGLDVIQSIMQILVDKHGGRPHWGKNGAYYSTRKVIQGAFGQNSIDGFEKIMKKYDSNGIFLNGFGRRLLGTENRIPREINVKHCALQDHCICKRDEDCGPSGKMKCDSFKKYRVCRHKTPLLNLIRNLLIDTFNK